jgi:hypothetical protein
MSCRRPVYDAFVMATAFASVVAMGCVNSETGESTGDGDSAQSARVEVDTLYPYPNMPRPAIFCEDDEDGQGPCGFWSNYHEDDWVQQCRSHGTEQTNTYYAPWDAQDFVEVQYVCSDHIWYSAQGFRDDRTECANPLVASSTLTPNGLIEGAVCCWRGKCGIVTVIETDTDVTKNWECVDPGEERDNPIATVGGVYKCVDQDGSSPKWELQP